MIKDTRKLQEMSKYIRSYPGHRGGLSKKTVCLNFELSSSAVIFLPTCSGFDPFLFPSRLLIKMTDACQLLLKTQAVQIYRFVFQ